MRRRRLLAGLAGAAVFGGGWAVSTGLRPTDRRESVGFEVDLVASETSAVATTPESTPSSTDAGTFAVPADRPTLIDFFSIGCAVCEASMPPLAAAHEQYGNRLRFLSLSTDPVGFSIEPTSLLSWWDSHDGAWALGVDRQLRVAEQVDVSRVPTAVVVDETGRLRGRTTGRKTREKLDALLEPIL